MLVPHQHAEVLKPSAYGPGTRAQFAIFSGGAIHAVLPRIVFLLVRLDILEMLTPSATQRNCRLAIRAAKFYFDCPRFPAHCCLLLPRGIPKSFGKNGKAGRGGGDRIVNLIQ
jgi:hypothetical protein